MPNRPRRPIVRAAVCALAALLATPALAQERTEEIIAAHIRMQGYACKEAQSAEHLREASKPNEAVWMLRCDNATYRIRLVPDMAATVELIK